MTTIRLDDLLASAIHPMAWQAWISEEILLKAGFGEKRMISNHNGLWIITDTDHKIIWSSEPVEIEEVTIVEEVKAQSVLNLFAMLGVNKDFEEDPTDCA